MAAKEPVGAVLAGGRGSRLGGSKATVDLAGRPLIAYPLAALAAAGLEAFIVAKRSTEIPTFEPGVRTLPAYLGVSTNTPVVIEPELPVHPLAGIVAALRHAQGPVVVIGCDFPFAPPQLLRMLAEAAAPLVVPAPGGDPQPLIARWTPELLPDLEVALRREEPLRRTLAALGPRLLGDADLASFGDPSRAFFNVNDLGDLLAAGRLIA